MGTPTIVGDRVLVSFTTTGTGTYTLGAALAGYLTPAGAGIATGARIAYTAVDSLSSPTTFEVGEGLYTATGTTLTRATIHRNSAGGTTAVSWAAGTKYLFLAPSTTRLPLLETDGRLTLTGGLNITSGGATITGTSVVSGEFATTAKLTVGSGGIAVAGNSTVTGSFTVTGAASVSSTLTAASGTTGSQVVTYAQFPATKAATGATTLPNGLVLKWGSGSTTNGSGSITYDSQFPTATLNVQLTIAGGSTPTTQSPLILGTASTAGFAVWGALGTNLAFQWLAIGH